MRGWKRDVKELTNRGLNSLILAVELFNRPHSTGRPEGVTLLLHHAFEMLLKAIIKDRLGSVHDKEGRHSYGFDKCLELAQNQLKVLSSDQRATLSFLDANRDIVAHYYQEVSEDLLYVQAQAAVTLFDDLLNHCFGQRLADLIPDRVLPISTRPPKSLQVLVDSDLSQIDALLVAGSRRGSLAAARLRPILALARARDCRERVTEPELRKAVDRRRKGDSWGIVFPEIAQLRLDTRGTGIPVYLRIRKDADVAVRVAKPGEAVVGTLIKNEISIWDKFNLSRNDLASKLGITGPRTSALIIELRIQEDPECYRVLKRKSTKLKGYSLKALQRLRRAIDEGLNVEEVWGRHRHLFVGRKSRRGEAT